ncbi:MAG: hypothetical protein SGPRY_002750 [Prymnesium sp.]
MEMQQGPLVAIRIDLVLALSKSKGIDINLLDSVVPIITETLQDEEVAGGSCRTLAGAGNARRDPRKTPRAVSNDFSKTRPGMSPRPHLKTTVKLVDALTPTSPVSEVRAAEAVVCPGVSLGVGGSDRRCRRHIVEEMRQTLGMPPMPAPTGIPLNPPARSVAPHASAKPLAASPKVEDKKPPSPHFPCSKALGVDASPGLRLARLRPRVCTAWARTRAPEEQLFSSDESSGIAGVFSPPWSSSPPPLYYVSCWLLVRWVLLALYLRTAASALRVRYNGLSPGPRRTVVRRMETFGWSLLSCQLTRLPACLPNTSESRSRPHSPPMSRSTGPTLYCLRLWRQPSPQSQCRRPLTPLLENHRHITRASHLWMKQMPNQDRTKLPRNHLHFGAVVADSNRRSTSTAASQWAIHTRCHSAAATAKRGSEDPENHWDAMRRTGSGWEQEEADEVSNHERERT